MKALSLRQPWAWLVVNAGKHIENRRWNTRFRGPFLIHAAKGMTRDEYASAKDYVQRVSPRTLLPEPKMLYRGGIIGRATLVDVIPPCLDEVPYGVTCACGRRWHMGKQYGFVLQDVTRLHFREVKGSLGFFEAPGSGS